LSDRDRQHPAEGRADARAAHDREAAQQELKILTSNQRKFY
jgi:hypothetical protein